MYVYMNNTRYLVNTHVQYLVKFPIFFHIAIYTAEIKDILKSVLFKYLAALFSNMAPATNHVFLTCSRRADYNKKEKKKTHVFGGWLFKLKGLDTWFSRLVHSVLLQNGLKTL